MFERLTWQPHAIWSQNQQFQSIVNARVVEVSKIERDASTPFTDKMFSHNSTVHSNIQIQYRDYDNDITSQVYGVSR